LPASQASPGSHWPHDPPQPSPPQIFPSQSGAQHESSYFSAQTEQIPSQQSPKPKHCESHQHSQSGPQSTLF
jgi:hypothetical protein